MVALSGVRRYTVEINIYWEILYYQHMKAITQKELADLLGINPSPIYHFGTGIHKATSRFSDYERKDLHIGD